MFGGRAAKRAWNCLVASMLIRQNADAAAGAEQIDDWLESGLVLLLQTSRRKLTRLSSTKFASHQKIGFGCIIAGKRPSRIFFSPNTNAASTCRREFHVATSSHFEFSSV